MKSTWLPALLTAALCVTAGVASWEGVRFFLLMRQVQACRGELAAADVIQLRVRGLVQDCVTYAQGNPALEPILNQFAVHLSRPGAAAPRPSSR